MNRMISLTSALLDLTHELSDGEPKLIIGGGFGLYLKNIELLKTRSRTLLHRRPEPRSTNDLDLFLRAEILTHAGRVTPLIQAIEKLNYRPVPEAKFYQFFKPGPEGGEAGSLKIDILTGSEQTLRSLRIKTKGRRAYPKPKINLHARIVEEALTLEEYLQTANIEGHRSDGESEKAEVFLPHPFTYIMMKCFALRDRIHDPGKDHGRHHALDLYSIVSMMTEEEWKTSLELRTRHAAETKIIEAGELISIFFKDAYSLGILRLKESPYYQEDFQITEFIRALRDLFTENNEHKATF